MVVHEYKVLLVGPECTGKTSWLTKYTRGVFDTEYVPSTTTDIYPIKMQIGDRHIVLNVWDCPGKYDDMRDILYKDSHAAIIMVDPSSLDKVDEYIEEVKKVSQSSYIVVVVNKVDDDNESFIYNTDSSTDNRNTRNTLLDIISHIDK